MGGDVACATCNDGSEHFGYYHLGWYENPVDYGINYLPLDGQNIQTLDN